MSHLILGWVYTLAFLCVRTFYGTRLVQLHTQLPHDVDRLDLPS